MDAVGAPVAPAQPAAPANGATAAFPPVQPAAPAAEGVKPIDGTVFCSPADGFSVFAADKKHRLTKKRVDC